MAKEFAELKDVEIFAAGTYYFPQEDGTEESITYSDDDVAEIAKNTNALIEKDKHSPPGKLGHDGAQAFAAASGLPAIGWATNLRAIKGKLVADFTDVPALAYKALKSKLYKKISSEIYHAEATAKHFGGAVKGLTLRAVAFLGADVPKVKGLAAFLSDLPTGKEAGADDARCCIFGEKKEEAVADKKLLVPANRHPYGALMTGADGADSGVESGKKYKVNNVHMDGTYDVMEDTPEGGAYGGKVLKRIPHDHLALMAEGSQTDSQKKEAQMAEKNAVELAEEKAKDAIQLAETNGAKAKAATEALAKMQKESRDKAVNEFCEKHKTRLIPALQPKFKALVNAAVETGAVKFGEGDEKPYVEGFMAFLSELLDAKTIELGEAAADGKKGGVMEVDAAEVALAEEPFGVHLAEASRSDVKPMIVHADLSVAAQEYMEKHPTMKFSEALKHVAKLEKASISLKGGKA